jgi:hypothetical protein
MCLERSEPTLFDFCFAMALVICILTLTPFHFPCLIYFFSLLFSSLFFVSNFPKPPGSCFRALVTVFRRLNTSILRGYPLFLPSILPHFCLFFFLSDSLLSFLFLVILGLHSSFPDNPGILLSLFPHAYCDEYHDRIKTALICSLPFD